MPATLTAEDVTKLAKLARIELTEEERNRLAGELQAILGAVETVSSVVNEDVVPTSHPIPLTNVFRDDVAKPGLTSQQALSGAPASAESRFEVPRILDEE